MTFLIAVAALIVAVLGCAWLKPIAQSTGHSFGVRPGAARKPAALASDDALSQR